MIEAGELVGSYRHAGNSGTIQLDLRDDKSFTETIIFDDGRRVVRRGTWIPPTLESPTIAIDGFWMPMEFSPDYINETSRRYPDQPKFTDPGLWVVHPERNLGTIELSIYPDSNIALRKSLRP